MIDDFVTDNPRQCDGFRQPDNLIIKFFLEILLSARSRCEWIESFIDLFRFIRKHNTSRLAVGDGDKHAEWVEV